MFRQAYQNGKDCGKGSEWTDNISMVQDAHAFLQVLDGTDGTTAYPQFQVADFRADDRHFAI